ncbi:MAG: transposase [Candidatus Margulisbacteria bacterium]|nr:transposase [Candidatus Margulisiibacteriota bacterium]
MSRKRRVYGPEGCRYSIQNRINDPDIMRFEDPIIARMIFEVFLQAKNKFGFQINMATIMGNHNHKQIKVNGAGTQISKIMHWINTTTAIRYNKLTGHKGRLWRERFTSYVIHDWSYFINTAVYIARNPEKANLGRVEEYHYSSAIFLYKTRHPLQEFEKYRTLFEEAYPGYFEEVKRFIEAQREDEQLSKGISMAPKRRGKPKKIKNC